MKKIYLVSIIVIIVILLAVSGFLVSRNTQTGKQLEGVRLTPQTPSASYKINEPVKFRLTIPKKQSLLPDRVIKSAHAEEPYVYSDGDLTVKASVALATLPDQPEPDVDIRFTPTPEGDMDIAILPKNPRSFRGGLYTLQTDITKSGINKRITQDFAWGVLTVNSDKSFYLPGDTVYLQMAALNNVGHTLCDANLKAEIMDPSGSTISIPDIEKSETCGADNVTDNPDYFAYYQIGQASTPGTYTIKLINNSNNYSTQNTFEIKNSVPYVVERMGATRINPFKAEYVMNIKITANEDFTGTVEEQLPEGFKVKSQNSNIITWDVTLTRGQNITLSYTYQAPQISPQIFLLGKIKMKQGETIVFEESRFWQLASDTACVAAGTGDWRSITWNTCDSSYPTAGDTASVGAYTVTIPNGETNAADSFTFTASGATLTVNGTLNISGAVTVNNIANASSTYTISGLGTLNADSLAVGVETIDPTTDNTTTLTSTITAFNVTNSITLTGQDTGPREGMVVVNLDGGSMSAASIALNTYQGGTADFTLANAANDTTLNLSSATPFAGTGTFVAASTSNVSTVNYSGNSATIKVLAYDNLTLSGTNPTIGALATINNNLLLSAGSASSATAGSNMTIGGTLTINANNALIINSTYTLGVTGATSISGTFTGSGSGIKTFTDTLTINNGGIYNNSGNSAVTLTGGLTQNGTFTSGSGTYTLNGSQTLNGGNAITFSGTGTAVAISGAVTVQNSNTNTVTISGAITGSAAGSTWQNNANSTVDFKGAVLATGILTATANPNTVKYSGSSSQALKTLTYHHLTIAHTGTVTDTLTSSTLTIAGNFVVGDGAAATTVDANTNDPDIDIGGSMTINASSIFTATSDTTDAAFTIAGNFTNSGAFNDSNGRLVLDTTDTSQLTYTDNTTFHDLKIATGGKTVEFDEAQSTIIESGGNFIVQGSDCSTNRVFLKSYVNGDAWPITVTGATVTVDTVDLRDSALTGTGTATNATEDNDGNSGWTISGGACGPPPTPTPTPTPAATPTPIGPPGLRFNGIRMQGIKVN